MQNVSYSISLADNQHFKFEYTCSLQNVHDFYSNKAQSFLAFFEKKASTDSKIQASTRKCHLLTYKLLNEFAPNLRFSDLTYQFLLDFEQYMISLSFCRNTIAKHMKHLKKYINLAIKENHIDPSRHPFSQYKICMEETVRSYLTPEELARIENLKQFSCHGLSRCRDLFLFSCYTGLRFSDITRLTQKDFQRIDKIWWLIFHTKKTNVFIRIPLSFLSNKKAITIFNKYRHNKQGAIFALSKNSNSDINKLLKLLMVQAKIDKPITFHSARHTFATLLLYEGAQITTVQRLLGHKSVRTTEVYSAIMDMTIIRDLQEVRKSRKIKAAIKKLNESVNAF